MNITRVPNQPEARAKSDTTRLSLGVRRTTDEFTSKQDNFMSILMPMPVIAAQTCDREVVTEYSSTTSTGSSSSVSVSI